MPVTLVNPFMSFPAAPSGYRYVRLNITATYGGGNGCQLSEISWYNGASRQSPVSISGPTDYGDSLENSQDGNTGTKWFAGSSTGVPHALIFDFGSNISLTSYSFTSGNDTSYADGVGARNPNSWTVATSNDGSTWTTIHTVSGANLAAVDETVVGTWSL